MTEFRLHGDIQSGPMDPMCAADVVGFSAGAAFAGGALLVNPSRYVGAALLSGTLPIDAGVATPYRRLTGTNVFVAHNTDDMMIAQDLLARAWTYLTEHASASVSAHHYQGGHDMSPEALSDLRPWIESVDEAGKARLPI